MPTLVPGTDGGERPLYFVLCDYGPKIGLSYYETDPEKSDRETIVKWIAEGQYTNPIRVIEVAVSEGTSRDVSAEIFEEAEALSSA